MKRLVLIVAMGVVIGNSGLAAAGNVPPKGDPNLGLTWPAANASAADVDEKFGKIYVSPSWSGRRMAPIWAEAGIDIAVPANEAVLSAAAGTVVEAVPPNAMIGEHGHIVIEHAGLNGATFTTVYIYVTNITVAPGATVAAQQVIANVNGATLNFGVRDIAYDKSYLAHMDLLPIRPLSGIPLFPEHYVDPMLYLP